MKHAMVGLDPNLYSNSERDSTWIGLGSESKLLQEPPLASSPNKNVPSYIVSNNAKHRNEKGFCT